MELISEELFKEYAPIKGDTVTKDFKPYIDMAQILYINKLLGPALIEELELQIEAAQVVPTPNPYPITPENKALLRMIAPPLSFYAVYQGLPLHWAAIVNKGVTTRESENSKAVDIKDISQLRRWIKDDAEVLLKNLTDYLCECAATYPLWKPGDYCGGCECDGETKKNNYDFGLFIPKRRR